MRFSYTNLAQSMPRRQGLAALFLLLSCAVRSAFALGPADVGEWGSMINFTTVPVAAAVLPNGKLVIWSSWDRYDFVNGTGARDKTFSNLYDPDTGVVTEYMVDQTMHDMFCPGTAYLEDGRLHVSGGGPQVATTSLYDFNTNQWTRDADMSRHRWYNTSTTLPNGSVFTLGGIPDDGIGEIWTDGSGWKVLSGTPITPALTLLDGKTLDRSTQHPRVLVAPNGKLFAAGPTPNMQWYDTQGNGKVQFALRRGDDAYAQNNVTVMYDVGKIIAAGGNPNYDGANAAALSSSNAYLIDINNGVTTKKITPMHYPRAYANGVVLPDGKVLVVGGKQDGKVFSDTLATTVPELFDPSSETWTEMAIQGTPRTYHSVALLLPDGRVFSGGGGLCNKCGVNHTDGEIYSPPYLFKGPRPSLIAAPAAVGFGSSFQVVASTDVARFTLVRLSSTTHTVNTDQRWLPVSHVNNGGGKFTLTSPANANLAPPGYYMLFALNAGGVPSVSKIVQITRLNAPVIQPIDLQSSPAGSAVNLQVSATSPLGLPLTYSASGLPTGVSINPGSGLISGTVNTVAKTTVSVTASDGSNSSVVNFDWSVYNTGIYRYAKLVEDSEIAGKPWGSAAEVAILDSNGVPITRSDLSVTTDSQELTSTPPAPATYAIDGNSSTFWHTEYKKSIPAPPHWLIFDLKAGYKIGGFSYLPRQSGVLNGTFGKYRFFVSTDGVNWANPVAQGTFAGNKNLKTVLLSTPPSITSPGNRSNTAGIPVNLPVKATSPIGLALSYSANGLPAGLAIDSTTGIVTGTPTTAGVYTVNLTVTDSSKNVKSITFSWSIFTAGPDRYVKLVEDSEINGKPFGSAAELYILDSNGVALSRTGWTVVADSAETTASNATPEKNVLDGNNGTYWMTPWQTTSPPPPHWLVIDMKTGYKTGGFRYLPRQTANIDGTFANYRFYVSSDGVNWGNPVAQGSFAANKLQKTATYTPVSNQAPVLSNPGNQSGLLNKAVSIRLTATDANGDKLTYSATGLPPGLSLNSTSGLISGAPTATGVYNVNLAVNDGMATVPATLTWSVAPPLTVSSLGGPPKAVNSPIAFTATAQGGLSPQFSWQFGDGTPDTPLSGSPNATHSYAKPGRYPVTLTAIDGTGTRIARQYTQAIHLPLTAQTPTISASIVYESLRSRVWNVNPDNDSVTVYDAGTRSILSEIPVGEHPHSLAFAPDGRLWVTNQNSANVSIIDPVSMQVMQTLPLPKSSQPYGIVFNPAGTQAFIALEATGELLRLDPLTGATTGRANVGANPRHLSVSADSTRIFVSRFITPRLPGEETALPQLTDAGGNKLGGQVAVVNTTTLAVTRTIVLQGSEAADTPASSRGIPNYLGAPVISPDGHSAWVPSKQDNIQRGRLRDGLDLNFENTVRGITSRIDLDSLSEDYASRLDHDNTGIASAGLYDPSGSYLFVALETSREVAIVDPYAHLQLMRFDVGLAPQGLAISPDGSTLFVHNFMDRTVGVYDLGDLMQRGETRIAALATYNNVTVDKLPAQVLLGKQLFYDARDPRLSRDRYLSCAVCHSEGSQDGRVWDLTGFGEGLRNTISLQGHGGTAHGRLHWSSNFDEIQDFEGQIRGLAAGTGLMSDADFNAGTRAQTLGTPKAGISADLDALAAYASSLTRFAASPYRNADGTLTADGVIGSGVYQAYQCATCHGGVGFTDSVVSKDTLHDVGTLKPSSGARLGGPLTGLDTPTLRGAWATGPYLHDGRAATLTDAVKAHTAAGISVPATANDLSKLESYLKQID